MIGETLLFKLPPEYANFESIDGEGYNDNELLKIGKDRINTMVERQNEKLQKQIKDAKDMTEKKRLYRRFVSKVKDLQVWHPDDSYLRIDKDGEAREYKYKGYGISFVKVFVTGREAGYRSKLPFSI